MKLSALANESISPDPFIKGIAVDSRAVGEGYLFAALPGVETDGARFIPEAEKRGAAALLARPGTQSTLPTIFDETPRRRLSSLAARFFPNQPKTIAAITGANGKTSTARFAASLWSRLGRKAGSIGTLGASGPGFERPLTHTTPEPITLHETLHQMAEAGTTHLALEASSHALAQHRVDGVRLSIAAFSNITQDHLDYHGDFESYLAAKRRLFDEVLPDDGAAVINADGAHAETMINAARQRGLRVLTTGRKGQVFRLLEARPSPAGMSVRIVAEGQNYALDLPLIGEFQVENVLLAAGIVAASGVSPADIAPLLDGLTGAPGRMERVAEIDGAGVYVDYAHTPDAVARALDAIRPHASGDVIAVIGAGGDRDKTKRLEMGKAAAARADHVIVTDDNPRTEDPASIRRAILEGCPEGEEIADRADAIAAGVARLRRGNVLLIAGKGHETGQQIGVEVVPFNDATVAREAVRTRQSELGR
ncbi:MAG: UDP-N-acetylmuramoyl-L-alanyl-D-glutamate--2,6-diaminopimelate ligase [Pseudomonadota bacterium]